MDDLEIENAVVRGIVWLRNQEPCTVKDISRSIQSLSMWDEPAQHLIELLQKRENDGRWETDSTITDTARACIALAACGIIKKEAVDWILDQQKGDNWNNNEIDTAYALVALSDCGEKNPSGCEWLFYNYGKKWEHAGTTSLIITALIKQDKNRYCDFIKNRAFWLLSKREDGGWMHTATSNLVIQALLYSGEIDIPEITSSIRWLLGKEENGKWENITATSLSLITLKMYMDKVKK